jgi:prepilin-type N-terminal cleavage/methylation domain-containing protein
MTIQHTASFRERNTGDLTPRLKSTGFTIVELLIVIVVVGILAAISLVAFTGVQKKAVVSTLQSDLAGAIKQLDLYRVDFGAYPTNIDGTTYCPTPAAPDYCLKASSGNRFINYTVNNSSDPQTVSLNAVSANGTQYFASNTSSGGESTDTFTMGSITGTVRTGSTVTAGALTPPAATVTRQWQRASASTGPFSDISGATSNTYAIPSGDIGMFLRVIATGTGTYSGTATSASTARITTLVTAIAPISGTPTVGQVLTAGARTPSAATVTFQWRSNGVAIGGATASTYTVASSDLGTTISVSVTGTTNYSGTVTSASTAPVN